jgi:hypothetical protein
MDADPIKPPSKRLAGLVLAVIVVELLLFRTNVDTNTVPFYPRNHDQVGTFLPVYRAYFLTRDSGLPSALRMSDVRNETMRSATVPAFSLVSLFLFGPNRWSFLLVNFAFFACGQLVLASVLRRRFGTAGACLGWGFFLLSGGLYYYAGGLDDMRFDLAGMVAFGFNFLALVSFVERPDTRRLAICLLASAFALLTRSITMVYILGTLGLLVGGLVAWQVFGAGGESGRRRLKLTFLLAVGTGLEYALHLLVYWRPLAGYYLALKLSDEDAIRWAQFTDGTLAGRLLFYPRSAWEHFHVVITVAAIVLGYFALARVRARLAKAHLPVAAPEDHSVGVALAVTGLTIIFPFIVLTIYAPSPVVIGVLTIPLAFGATTALMAIHARLQAFASASAVGVLVAVLGFGNFADAMITPRSIAPGWHDEADAVAETLEHLSAIARASDRPITVLWMTVHDGLNFGAWQVFLYEHRGMRQLTNGSLQIAIFKIDEATLRKRIADSDVVVALDEPDTQGFLYPSMRSIRDMKAIWKAELALDFQESGRHQLSGARDAVIYRRARRHSFHLDFSSAVPGSGWWAPLDNAVWSSARESTIEVPIEADTDYAVELHWKAAPLPDEAKSLALVVNDHPIELTQTRDATGSTCTASVPRDAITRAGKTSFKLVIPRIVSPHSLGINEDTRPLGLLVDRFTVDPATPSKR